MMIDTKYNFLIIPSQQTPAVPLIGPGLTERYLESRKEVFNAFHQFAKTQRNACGLAANQCSLNGSRFNERVFALMDMKTREWSLIVNPLIIGTAGIKEKKSELCLTWVGSQIIAERSKHIKACYFNQDGSFVDNHVVSGFEAQIWQHEINHLNGVPEQIERMNYKLPVVKINRNEPCPCLSGKKYKFCCI